MKEIKKMLTHVFTATANPLNSRRRRVRREGDGGAACAVDLAPMLIGLYVAVTAETSVS